MLRLVGSRLFRPLSSQFTGRANKGVLKPFILQHPSNVVSRFNAFSFVRTFSTTCVRKSYASVSILESNTDNSGTWKKYIGKAEDSIKSIGHIQLMTTIFKETYNFLPSGFGPGTISKCFKEYYNSGCSTVESDDKLVGELWGLIIGKRNIISFLKQDGEWKFCARSSIKEHRTEIPKELYDVLAKYKGDNIIFNGTVEFVINILNGLEKKVTPYEVVTGLIRKRIVYLKLNDEDSKRVIELLGNSAKRDAELDSKLSTKEEFEKYIKEIAEKKDCSVMNSFGDDYLVKVMYDTVIKTDDCVLWLQAGDLNYVLNKIVKNPEIEKCGHTGFTAGWALNHVSMIVTKGWDYWVRLQLLNRGIGRKFYTEGQLKSLGVRHGNNSLQGAYRHTGFFS